MNNRIDIKLPCYLLPEENAYGYELVGLDIASIIPANSLKEATDRIKNMYLHFGYTNEEIKNHLEVWKYQKEELDGQEEKEI